MRMIRTAVLFVVFFAGTVLRAETRMGGVAGNTTTTDWSTGVSYTYDPSGNVTGTGSDRYAYDEVAGWCVRT